MVQFPGFGVGNPENCIVAIEDVQFGWVAIIVGVAGMLFTVTRTLSVLLQLLPSVPVTV